MVEELVHRYCPVTLEEEGGRIKVLNNRVNNRKLSKYTRDTNSDQAPLELATTIWYRAERRSGYERRC